MQSLTDARTRKSGVLGVREHASQKASGAFADERMGKVHVFERGIVDDDIHGAASDTVPVDLINLIRDKS